MKKRCSFRMVGTRLGERDRPFEVIVESAVFSRSDGAALDDRGDFWRTNAAWCAE